MRLPIVGQGFCALVLAGALAGCGAQQPSCNGAIVTTISPMAGVADHMAVAPGDQQLFTATSGPKALPDGSGCAISNVLARLTPTWSVSDATDVKISSAQDATNGVATCLGATKAPVTVTAVGSPVGGGVSQVLGTATLTCK